MSAGLRSCGADKLFLEIHDASFPADSDEDTGRGTPYSDGARRFIEQVARLGFNGLQLGPQGLTSADNPSPYDGTLFSRNPMSLALSPLRRNGLLSDGDIRTLLAERPPNRHRVAYDLAFAIQSRACDLAYGRFIAERSSYGELAQQLAAFNQVHGAWLIPDALYSVLFLKYGRHSWRDWSSEAGPSHLDTVLFSPPPDLETRCAARRADLIASNQGAVDRYRFVQFLLHEQHAQLREWCRHLPMKLYADLQIGLSNQDVWAHQGLLMPNYRMGAPPSRTNPLGQPWGFGVLDPAQYRNADGSPGPVMDFVRRRLRKIYAEYDGVRIDHPHGWVCPWVYRSDIEDPFAAVQQGARLFSSPDLANHPALRVFSYVQEEQLDRGQARHADHWERYLTKEQIDAYAQVFACLVDPDGTSIHHDLVCEVLSTLPLPLEEVLDQFGLGRFRVLQKVDPHNPTDVYRSERAEPVDWIMLGNHDTPPIWKLAKEWIKNGSARDRAEDLATRLVPPNADKQQWIEDHARQEGALVHALFADLLISRARNIMVFFADLFGLEEQYNVPGTVQDSNWSVRVPPDYEHWYLKRLADDRALNLPYALSIALRAPGFESTPAGLLELLDQEAERLRERGRHLP